MTDLPRDDDGKRANPAIAATYKFGNEPGRQPLIVRETTFSDRPGVPFANSRCAAPDLRFADGTPVDLAGGGEFSSPLDPAPAPFQRHPSDPAFDGFGVLHHPVTPVFNGLEPAVTRIGECYPGAAAAARGTGRDAMGGHIGGWAVSKTQAMIDAGEIAGVKSADLSPVDRVLAELAKPEPQAESIDDPLVVHPSRRRFETASRPDFDRPLDADFDSALLRQLDDRERLSADLTGSSTNGTIEAAIAATFDQARARQAAFGMIEREVMSDRGPVELRQLGRPVPARNSAPPYSWMADQERYEDSATAGLDADYRAQVRASRLWVGFAGLALVVGLLAIFFYRQ